MSVALSVPNAELPEFGHMKFQDRNDVLLWMDILSALENADNKAQAVIELCDRYAETTSISKGTLYRKRTAYKLRGWRGLVNASKVPAYSKRVAAGLPAAFVEFWGGVVAQNQRKIKPAYRSLFYDHLIPCRPINGYGTWRDIWRAENPDASLPEACPYTPGDHYPAGWSYRNLLKNAPTEYELKAFRIGTAAASEHLPSMPGTRVGLPAFSVVMMDDVHHDVKVKFPGNREPQICVEIGALDLLTGFYGPYFVKPVRERADETREYIRERIMRYLVADIVCVRGFNPGGLLLVGEHGTARLPQSVVESLNRYAPGLIRFRAGGIQDAPIFKGLPLGLSRGNFHVKAALESHHALKKNELARLPGQKGADPEHAPEDLASKVREHRWLMLAAHALMEERPDIIERLQSEFPSYHDYMAAVHGIYDRINDRAQHNLEGWDECGFTKEQWRLMTSEPFQPMSKLREFPADEQAAIRALIHANPTARHRRVFMTPREAHQYSLRTTELMRLPEFCIAELLGPELAQPITIGKSTDFTFPDPEIPGKCHAATALVETPHGHQIILPKGEKLIGYLNPFTPTHIYLYRDDMSYVGRTQVLSAANVLDDERRLANIKVLSQIQAQETKRLAPVGRQRLAAMQERLQNNVQVLTGRDLDAEAETYAEIEEHDYADADLVAATRRDDDEDEGDLGIDAISELLRTDR